MDVVRVDRFDSVWEPVVTRGRSEVGSVATAVCSARATGVASVGVTDSIWEAGADPTCGIDWKDHAGLLGKGCRGL